MFLDFRILVEINDILKYTKEFERRILKEERMSERTKTRSLLQRRPLSSLSGARVLNDSTVYCQIPSVTEPQRDRRPRPPEIKDAKERCHFPANSRRKVTPTLSTCQQNRRRYFSAYYSLFYLIILRLNRIIPPKC